MKNITLAVLLIAQNPVIDDKIYYSVSYGVDKNNLNINFITEETEALITDLKPETKYYFSVTAIQNEVESQSSPLIEYTTPSQENVDEVQFSEDLINWKTEVYVPNRTGSKTRFVRIKPKVVTEK